MITKVGMQTDFAAALQDLVELELDAVQAYQAAVDRIEDPLSKNQLGEFLADHRRHVDTVQALLRAHQQTVPTEPSGKQWLAKGKVVIGGLLGDAAVLAAMRSNEQDTNTAYERIVAHEGLWPDAKPALEQGLADERRHRDWLEQALAVA